MVEKKWTWIPNVRLNNIYYEKKYIYFDDFIKDKKYNICYYGDGDGDGDGDVAGYESITDGANFIFTKKDNVFERAEVWSHLYLNGEDLIGKTIEDVKLISGVNDFTIDPKGYFYSSESLNAIFWVVDGKVESVSM